MSGKIATVDLDELIVNKSKVTNKKGAVNILSATFIHPNEEQASITAIQALDIKDGIRFSYNGKPPSEKMLFKVRLVGETEIQITISYIDNPSWLDKLLFGAFKGAFGAGLGIVTGGIGNIIVAGAATATQGFILDSIKLKEENVFIIGKGAFFIDADGKIKNKSIALKVPDDIPISGDRGVEIPPDGEVKDSDKSTTNFLDKDDENGSLKIKYQFLNS